MPLQKLIFIFNIYTFLTLAVTNGTLALAGEIIPFKKVFKDYRTATLKKEYRSSSKQCKGCPLQAKYLGRTANEKKFSVSYYKEEYDRNIERVESKQGRYMKAKRQSTVEPVFETLTQFMGLRKINTIGLQQANKKWSKSTAIISI